MNGSMYKRNPASGILNELSDCILYRQTNGTLLMLCDQPILVRGTITKFLILIIPIYRLFTIDKRRVNLKVQYSVVRK